jgi:hypothetical protein
VWTSGGKELIYVASAGNGQFVSTKVTASSTVTFGSPTPLKMPFVDRVSTDRRDFDVLPDGRFIGIGTSDRPDSTATSVSEIRVVLNWFEELKARVPVK